MKELLQKLFRRRSEDVKLIIVDDERPENPETYIIRPIHMLFGITGGAVALVLVFFLFLYVTPFGGMLFRASDQEMRDSVEEISRQVIALQDSLDTRDEQLAEMQSAVAGGTDTTFTTGDVDVSDYMHEDTGSVESPAFQSSRFEGALAMDPNQIIHSAFLSSDPSFPVSLPVEGTTTRMYKPESNHYGLDIAAEEGAIVTSIADGVVINSDRTMDNGYVIYVQHSGGYVSVYKHCRNLMKQVGDVVRSGDIIASVGSTGLHSSGPHLHLELWNNGVPLDPELYFHNIN